MKKVIEKQAKEEKVNVYDDAEMVALGIRNPKVPPRDPKVWTKTIEEKAKARVAKNSIKSQFSSGWGHSCRTIPVYGKLIVYIKPSSRFCMVDPKTGKKINKTVFSHNCGQSDISRILSKYKEIDNKLNVSYSIVTKYSWNGKTYNSKELPFWK